MNHIKYIKNKSELWSYSNNADNIPDILDYTGKKYKFIKKNIVTIPKELSNYITSRHNGDFKIISTTAKKQLSNCPFSIEELLLAADQAKTTGLYKPIRMYKSIYVPLKFNINFKFAEQTGGSDFDNYALADKQYRYVGATEEILTDKQVEEFNYKGKNVGYISGCFCPAHKGHYSTIRDACIKNNLNTLLITSVNRATTGSGARHGLPANVTLKLLTIYARQLYREFKTEFIIAANMMPVRYLNSDMNNLFMYEVVELDREPTKQDIEKGMLKEQTNPLLEWSKQYLSKFSRTNSIVFISVLFRNEANGISATSFVKSMIEFLKTIKEGRPESETRKALEVSGTYLPDFLPEKDKFQLINDMVTEFGPFLIGDKEKS